MPQWHRLYMEILIGTIWNIMKMAHLIHLVKKEEVRLKVLHWVKIHRLN